MWCCLGHCWKRRSASGRNPSPSVQLWRRKAIEKSGTGGMDSTLPRMSRSGEEGCGSGAWLVLLDHVDLWLICICTRCGSERIEEPPGGQRSCSTLRAARPARPRLRLAQTRMVAFGAQELISLSISSGWNPRPLPPERRHSSRCSKHRQTPPRAAVASNLIPLPVDAGCLARRFAGGWCQNSRSSSSTTPHPYLLPIKQWTKAIQNV